jgi:hypothetical protein
MWVKTTCAIVVVLTALVALPQQAPATARLTVYACRNLVFQDTGQGVHPTATSCGREFPTSVPYVVLWMQLDDVDRATTLTWLLLDPTGAVYANDEVTATPPNAYYKWILYDYLVLPVGATTKDILEQNPRFRNQTIEVGATPVSQMPGQWKLQTSLDGRPTGTLTFTLRP